MGIEAFCPSGHRIKVKDSYAGKRAYCPTCGAKFRVPRQSTAAIEDALPTDVLPTDALPTEILPTAKLLNLDPQAVAALPRARPLDPMAGEDGQPR